jgi:hypothetical protein
MRNAEYEFAQVLEHIRELQQASQQAGGVSSKHDEGDLWCVKVGNE